MAWRKNLSLELVKRAKSAAGGVDAWNRILTPALKHALIAEQVLSVVISQEETMAIRSNDVHELFLEALRGARLE